MFLDESGFLLIPSRRRTWGPRGQTPIVPYSYRHDRISAIAAISVAPKRARTGLYVRFRQENFTAERVSKFLRVLLHHLRGEIILLWDGAQIHKGPFIQEIQAAFPRLHLERFPAYAPELNPVEFLWQDFKKHSGNSVFRNKQDVRLALHGNTRRVQQAGGRLRSFVLASDLPSAPWQ